jgi:hypothetical protein
VGEKGGSVVTWLWVILAFFVGAWFGVLVMALMAAGRRGDDLSLIQAVLWDREHGESDDIPW